MTAASLPTIDAPAPPSPELNSKVLKVLEGYLAELEGGAPVNPEQLLARHPELAAPLREYLASLEFLHRAALSLHGSDQTRQVASEPTIAEMGTLGDFRILREIGRGGMGIVYEAEQISLGRRVALKVLPFAAALDAKQLQRFKNEAHAAAHLQHQNIVPVYFVGCERGVHFYAMQFVEGQTLAALIQESRQARAEENRSSKIEDGESQKQVSHSNPMLTGPYTPADQQVTSVNDQAAGTETAPLTPRSSNLDSRSSPFFRTVANLGIQAAEALEHAHQLGVIHRDVKPANLMVDARGNLWITDFGLAHCQGGCELTMSGDLLGTLRYMSPEQALAKRVIVDERTDIYSLGVTLYELLTLEPAFPGTDRQEVLRQIAFEEPKPPRRWNKAIPQELETIVLKAMAKNPDERYATARDMADDLRRFLEDKPIKAKRPNAWQRLRKWRRRHKTVVTAATVVVLVILVAAASSSLVMWRAYRAEVERRQRTLGSLKFAFNVLGGTYQSLIHLQPGADPETKKEQDALLKRALDFYQQFAEENADDPAVRIEVSLGYAQMANIYKSLGDYERAKEAFSHAFALIEQAAAERQMEPNFQAFLGAAYFSLGLFQADEGNLSQAIELDKRGIEILSQLPRNFLLAEPRCKFWLADAYKSLGNHFKEQGGPWNEAVDNYKKANEVVTELRVDFPQEPSFARFQAAIHLEMGNALRGAMRWEGGASDREGSKDSYRRAIQIQTQLTKQFPEGFPGSDLVTVPYTPHAELQSDLALSHHNLANVLRERDEELSEAEQHYREAVKSWTQADKRLPNMAKYKWWLGMAHNNLSSLLADKGEGNEANVHIEKAVEFLQAAVKISPKDVRFRDELISGLLNLGNILEDQQRIQEAEQAFRDAWRTCQDVTRNSPQVQQLGRQAGSAFALAHSLMGTGRKQEAKDICQQALALADTRDEVELLNQLAWQLSICPDPELRNPQRAVELAKKAVKEASDKGDFWNTLGAAEYRAGHWTAARDAFGQSMKLSASPGGDSSDWFFLAMIHWQLGDKQKARDFFKKAADHMDQYLPGDRVLRRFRAEAAKLLGIDDPGPKRNEASSKKN